METLPEPVIAESLCRFLSPGDLESLFRASKSLRQAVAIEVEQRLVRNGFTLEEMTHALFQNETPFQFLEMCDLVSSKLGYLKDGKGIEVDGIWCEEDKLSPWRDVEYKEVDRRILFHGENLKLTVSSDDFLIRVHSNGAVSFHRKSAIGLQPTDEPSDPTDDIAASWPPATFSIPRLVQDRVKIRTAACSRCHVALIGSNGDLYTMGDNGDGQLGLGEAAPIFVKSPSLVRNLSGVKDVSCGYYHTGAVTSDGSVFCCGFNLYGQLGLGREEVKVPKFLRVNMSEFQSIKAESICCSAFSTFVVSSFGLVYVFGKGTFGCLGVGSEDSIFWPCLVEYFVREKKRVVSVAAGRAHTIFLTSDGKLFGTGHARYGQLIERLDDPYQTLEPIPLYTPEFISSIACGYDYTVLQPQNDIAPLYVFGRCSP